MGPVKIVIETHFNFIGANLYVSLVLIYIVAVSNLGTINTNNKKEIVLLIRRTQGRVLLSR